MNLATFYFSAFLIAQVVGKKTALSFGYEVETFFAVFINKELLKACDTEFMPDSASEVIIEAVWKRLQK